MELTVNAIGVSHGVIDENNLRWAKLEYLSDELQKTETSVGYKVSKLRLNTDDNNALAKRAIALGLVPGVVKVNCSMQVKNNETFLKVEDIQEKK